MTIIEQAARRLEELRRSGIEVPASPPQKTTDAANAGSAQNVPSRFVRKGDESGLGAVVGWVDAPSASNSNTPAAAQVELRSREVQIDLARLAASGYVTPETPRAQIADEFRVIKRPLLKNVDGRGAVPVERANLIMVTSSLPGEGKTFIAVNLAISIAMELDKTVLLVDADVSRPSVLQRLGLAPAPGLLDLLTGRAKGMSDVLLSTNIDKLSILPAGAPQGRATELLASDSMERLLEELAARYGDRVVVFDAPPLLPSTESRVLATHMGQVVLVVEAGRTAHKSVEQSLATLEACPVVMPLLNKISRSEVGSYYGYYGPIDA